MLSEETEREIIVEAAMDADAVKKDARGRPVLVTTEYRGVFFGYADDTLGEILGSNVIVLRGARNCIYWHKSVGGFAGLAVTGPDAQCRIGAEVSQIELRGITSVSEVSTEAAKAWESAPCVS